MEEKKQASLFREKSMEAIQSPESLNDYLRVTSPGVWLVLTVVIALLTGAILWSVFGRINTSMNVAVVSDGAGCVCLVPYESLEEVMGRDVVNVEGTDYRLVTDGNVQTSMVTEETSPYIRVAGGLQIGEVTVAIPVAGELAEGVYTGTVITESLQPMSLLLQ